MSSTGPANCCSADVLTYNSLQRRWTKNKSLKTWWDSLDAQAKATQYLQHAAATGQKRKFDGIEYSEGSLNEAYDGSQEEERCIPWWSFKAWKISEDPKRMVQDIAAEFVGMVLNPEINCVFTRGQWCVPRFEGVLRVNGSRTSAYQRVQRQKAIQDTTELAILREGGAALVSSFASANKNAMANHSFLPADQPVADDAAVEDQPCRSIPAIDPITLACTREAVIPHPPKIS